MNCQTFEQNIVDYLDGTLSHNDACDADAHLQQCAACQRLMAQERAISEQLQQWPALKCPEGVTEQVFQKIARKQPRSAWSVRWEEWLTSARLWRIGVTTAAMLVLFVLMLMYQGGETPPVQQDAYSSDEIEQAKQEIVLTLAYVHYYTEKTGNVLEDQFALTQTAITRPVQTVLEQQIESAQTAIRRPVERGVKETVTSIINIL